MTPPTASTDGAAAIPATQANAQITATYEDLPYDGHPCWQTHIDRLAGWARFCGMSPAPVTQCRVLEIGCAAGANLLPMADEFPGSEFVGIDLSPRAIAIATRTAAGAGLKNARFEVRDLAKIPGDFGSFDYIIAHGVFAWIPRELQPKMLAMIARHLSPTGIAYVSYNTYPGWHAHQILRDMMLYHTRNATSHQEVVTGGRQFIGAITAAIPADTAIAPAVCIRQDAQVIAGAHDGYVAHDHLSVCNNPVYFHQFVTGLQTNHLTWLREAHPNILQVSLPAEVRKFFPAVADNWVDVEQYIDFMRVAQFRSSLVVHDDQAFNRTPEPAAIEPLHLRARLTIEPGQPEPVSAAGILFKTQDNLNINIKDAQAQVILVALCKAAPKTLSHDQIVEVVRNHLHGGDPGFASPGSQERFLLNKFLHYGVNSGILTACSTRAPLTTTVPPQPLASALARYEARANGEITSRLHFGSAGLSRVDRVLIAHLNGARDRAALERVLLAAIGKGIIPDPVAADAAAAGWQGAIGQTLDGRLAAYAADGLLIEAG